MVVVVFLFVLLVANLDHHDEDYKRRREVELKHGRVRELQLGLGRRPRDSYYMGAAFGSRECGNPAVVHEKLMMSRVETHGV